MGPTNEVVTDEPITNEQLLAIDELLSQFTSKITRTRKGKSWTLWIGERPVDVRVSAPTCIALAAGLKSQQDYDILRKIGDSLAARIGGIASGPIK